MKHAMKRLLALMMALLLALPTFALAEDDYAPPVDDPVEEQIIELGDLEPEPTEVPAAEDPEAPPADEAELPVAEEADTPDADAAQTPDADATNTPDIDATETPDANTTEPPEPEEAQTPAPEPTDIPDDSDDSDALEEAPAEEAEMDLPAVGDDAPDADQDTDAAQGFVVVRFVAVPESAAIEVYDAGSDEPIPPREDGAWELTPGDYEYSAWAEDCLGIEREAFSVTEGDAEFEIAFELNPMPVAFDQTRTVDGVAVTVRAEAGAFPADAELSVRRVPVPVRQEAETAVEDARDEAQNVAVSYTFDISVLDAQGNELQPADGMAVSVSFALAQAADENLEANVYHVTEDADGALTADRLEEVEVDAAEETVTAQTDGFSIYTVEFTYDDLQYVVEGGARVPLNEIVRAVGLTGEAQSASVSDAALFSVSDETGEWVLASHRPFATTEWLKVVVGGVEYEITVTDDQTPVTISYMDGTTSKSASAYPIESGVSELGDELWFAVTGNVALSDRLDIQGNVNLILCDNCTLTASEGVRLADGSSLTVWAQSGGTGALTASTEEMGYAAIGGDEQEAGGTFVVHGGVITATSRSDAAGIGGGDSRRGGAVTIYGGTVTAQGGSDGAGIGGGLGGSQGGAITIYGGTVNATGGKRAAGIGGGENFSDEFGNEEYGGNGGIVNIWGGEVNATGGICAAGIGGGQFGNGGQVTISGDSKVTAVAGSSAEAVGRGEISEERGAEGMDSGKVAFSSNATVNAGDSAGSAIEYTGSDREAGCRNPYAHIVSTPEAVARPIRLNARYSTQPEDPKDTFEILDAEGDPITEAQANDPFVVKITMVDTSLQSLTVTYVKDGETRTLPPSPQAGLPRPEATTINGVNVYTETFTMPDCDEEGVTVEVVLAVSEYAIVMPSSVAHGTVKVMKNGRPVPGDSSAAYDQRVTLQALANDGEPDYFLQKLIVRGRTSGKVYARLENDMMENITMGPTEDLWIFKMPREDVVVEANFALGCRYIGLEGKKKIRRYFHRIHGSYADLTMNGSGTEAGWYVIDGNTTVANRLNVTGDVNIILCDGATLYANDGIFIAKRLNASLTIWAQSYQGGEIKADASGTYWAGIGGNERDDGGPLTINGGVIRAQGGQSASGIGGGKRCHHGTVTINVPKGMDNNYTYVVATGGEYGAGIGGGEDVNNRRVVVNGGYVEAHGGKSAAGIGGGYAGGQFGEDSRVTINGGEVKAYGGQYGAGIGGGEYQGGGGGGGYVDILGGKVHAEGGENGAGIGGGEDGNAGICTIKGGTVYAKGGYKAAGIGGGEDKPGGTFTMYGGNVEVHAGDKGNGIGGASGQKGGTAAVYGGTLEIFSGCNSAIGAGADNHDEGPLTLGDTLMVYAGDRSPGSLIPASARRAYVQGRKYAKIMPCNHPNATYEQYDKAQHLVTCSTCNANKAKQPHEWHGSQEETCALCGYTRAFRIYYSQKVGGRDADIWVNTYYGPVAPNMYKAGAEIEINVAPYQSQAYRVGSNYSLVDANGKAIPCTVTNDGSTYCYTFTMPYSDVSFHVEIEKKNYTVYTKVTGNGKATVSRGKGGAYDSEAEANYRDEVFVRVEPGKNQYLCRLYAWQRLPDGTPGYSLVKLWDVNGREIDERACRNFGPDTQISLMMPAIDVTVYAMFAPKPRVEVCQVFEVLKDNGDTRWQTPDEVADPIRRVIDSYTVPEKPVSVGLPEHMTADCYDPACYSFGYQADDSGRKGTGRNATIVIPEDQDGETLYIYYRLKDYRLTYYTNPDHSKGIGEYSYVPVGMDITKGYLPGDDAMQRAGYTFKGWTTFKLWKGQEFSWKPSDRDEPYADGNGKVRYVLYDFDASPFMPNEPLTLYPVYVKNRLAVRLDLGAYDANADDTNGGKYWGSDLPTYEDGDTNAYLDPYQYRSFMTDLGEKIAMDGERNEGTPEGQTRSGMNQATRDGYELVGWYTQRGVKWDASWGTSSAYCDTKDGEEVVETSDDGYLYYVMTLKARWKPRKAKIVYDLAGGHWNDGEAPTPDLILNYGYAEKLWGKKPVYTTSGDQLARTFAGWMDNAGVMHGAGQAIVYTKDLDLVTEIGTGEELNEIKLTATYRLTPAGYAYLYFDTQGGGIVSKFTVPVDEGIQSVNVTVSGVKVRESGSRYFTVKSGQYGGTRGVPTRKGYTFNGWKRLVDDTVTIDENTPIEIDKNSSKTVYADWSLNQHKITFTNLGGADVVIENVNYGTALPLASGWPVYVVGQEYADKPYHTFNGWNPEVPATMPDGDLTLTAQWRLNKYTLTINANGGKFANNENEVKITASYDSPINPPANPTRDGCVFRGWKLKDEPTGDFVALPKFMPGGNQTYVAIWKSETARPDAPKAEAIHATSLTIKAEPGQVYRYKLAGAPDTAYSAWTAPEEGANTVTFTGLTPEATYEVVTYIPETETAVASPVSMPTALSLPDAVLVRLDLGAADTITPATLDPSQPRSFASESGATIDMVYMDRVYRTGYVPTGWYNRHGTRWSDTEIISRGDCDTDESGEFVKDTVEIDGMTCACYVLTLTARWQPRKAKIVYDVRTNGGRWPDGAPSPDLILDFGGTGSLTAVKPVIGNTMQGLAQEFDAWLDRNGVRHDAGNSVTYGDLSMVTRYGSGDSDASGEYAPNEIKLTATYMLTPAGNAFLAFDSQGGSPVSTYAAPLEAGVTSATVTVSKAEVGESGIRYFIVKSDGKSRSVHAPVLEGHTFNGWKWDEHGTTLLDNQTEIEINKDETVTVYADWSLNRHRITFTNLGGQDVVIENVNYGTALPLTSGWPVYVVGQEYADKPYHTFNGWSPEVPRTMPDGDLTLAAQWTPKDYTLTINANGGRFVNNQDKIEITQAYASELDLPADPRQDGHVFQGWKLADASGQPTGYFVALPEAMPGGNQTYVAIWKRETARPDAPEVEDIHATSLTVQAVTGQMYGYKLAGDPETAYSAWSSPAEGESTVTFKKLTPGETYEVVTYIPETEAAVASPVSMPATLTLRDAVLVRLDLGAHDANNTAGQDPYTDIATQAYLDVRQPRAFAKESGEAIDMTALDAITRDGYYLVAWYNQNGTQWTSGEVISRGDCDTDENGDYVRNSVEIDGQSCDGYVLTLAARWNLRNATLTYDAGRGDWEAGTNPEPQVANPIKPGAAVTVANAPAPPSDKYEFNGYVDANGNLFKPDDEFSYADMEHVSTIASGTTGDNNEIKLTAQFVKREGATNKLIFVTNAESATHSPATEIADLETENDIVTRAEVEAQGVPTCLGSTFAGWYEDADCNTPVTYPIVYDENTTKKTVYAKWTLNEHDITFRVGGGNYDVIPVPYGTDLSGAIDLTLPKPTTDWPDDPRDEGAEGEFHYVFDGWDPEPYVRSMPDEDVTMRATWKPKDYTITLNANDGKFEGDKNELKLTGAYGTPVTPPADPTYGGHALFGWTLQGGDGAVVSLPELFEGNQTYVAFWKTVPAAPAAPTGTPTDISISVNEPDAAYEYRIREASAGESAWGKWMPAKTTGTGAEATTTMEFSGLTPNTEYWIQARVMETDDAAASEPSDPASIKTNRTTQPKPEPPEVDATVTSLSIARVRAGLEYQISETNTSWPDDWKAPQGGRVVFEGLRENTPYYVRARYRETVRAYASEPSVATEAYTLQNLLTGVTLSGEAVVGQQLTAKPEPVDVTGVSYRWYRGDEPIGTRDETTHELLPYGESTYLLTARDVGQVIRVEAVQSTRTHSRPSYEARSDEVKKQTSQPPRFTVACGTTAMMATVINPAQGVDYEYSLDSETWQDEPYFLGLFEDTGYTVYARAKETPERYASEPATVQANTLKTLLTSVSIEGEAVVGQTLKASAEPASAQDLAWQWTRDGKPIPDATRVEYALTEADIGAVIGVTAVQTVRYADDVTRSAQLGRVKKQPGPAAQTPTLASRTADSLTINTRPGEEYSIDGGATWQTGATFAGLDPATTYEIVARVAETATAYAGPVSAPLTATTDKLPQGPVEDLTADPSSSQGASDGAIHGVGPGMEYSGDDGKTWKPVTGDAITGLVAGDYWVRRAEDDTHYPGPAARVTVPTTALDVSALLIATMRAVEDDKLNATWTGVQGADGYDVYFTGCGSEDFQLVGSVPGSAPRSMDFTGLDTKRGYKVVVKAWMGEGDGKKVVAESPVAHCYTSGGAGKLVNPASITLKKTDMTIRLGKTRKISAGVKGVRKGKVLAHDGKLRYISDNPAVATVTAKGKVKAVGPGCCAIYVLTSNGIWKTVNVTVDDRPTRVKLTGVKKTMRVGDTQALGGGVKLYAEGARTILTWTSSNSDVLRVDGYGNLTAVSPGRATITVTTHNGKKARVKIKVRARQD